MPFKPESEEEKDIKILIGKRLRGLREKKEKSMFQAAIELKSTPSAIGMYELGRRTPNAARLKQFALYYGVSVDIEDLQMLLETINRITQKTRKFSL